MFADAALFVIHMAAIVAVLAWGFRGLGRETGAAICALFILWWSDLVATALILSTVSALGNRPAHIALSLLLAFLYALWQRTRTPPFSAAAAFEADPTDDTWLSRLLRFGLWGAIGAVMIPTILICFTYAPNNYDSVAYRLSRGYLYIGQGSVMHLPAGDFRMITYPFDAALAYLAVAIHELAGRWNNLFSLVCWAIGGIAVHAAARELGANRTTSLLAAMLFLTAPSVLISASSTNDDMIAGVPMAIAVMFGARWWRTARPLDLALAATSVGLSVGSKLHLVFLLPVGAAFMLVLVARLVRSGRLAAEWHSRWWHLLAGTAVAVVLVVPSFAINVAYTGRLGSSAYDRLQNSPFSFVSAAVNTVVSSASLFFAPIPDLYLDPDMEKRRVLYSAFNTWPNEHLFWWVSSDLNYSDEPNYRFEGVAASDGYWGLWEQSSIVGFLPWLLLIVLIVGWRGTASESKATRTFRIAALWASAAFFSWHLARCVLLKYVGAAGIYYAFVGPFAAIGAAYLWPLAAGLAAPRLRVIAGLLCLFAVATSLVFAANTFMFNIQRNIPALLQTGFKPQQPLTDADLTAALRASSRTMVVYSQWEEPLHDLISVQPKAIYALATTLAAKPNAEYDTELVLQRVRSEYGEVTLRFNNDDRQRLSPMGLFQSVYGEQRAFGRENLEQPKAASDYVVAAIGEQWAGDGTLASVRVNALYGVDPEEQFTVSFDVYSAKGELLLAIPPHELQNLPWFDVATVAPESTYARLSVWRRDNPSIRAEAYFPTAGGKQMPLDAWLPPPAEH